MHKNNTMLHPCYKAANIFLMNMYKNCKCLVDFIRKNIVNSFRCASSCGNFVLLFFYKKNCSNSFEYYVVQNLHYNEKTITISFKWK